MLWEQALDAAYSPNLAQAAALIDKYRSKHPDDRFIRLLHARNLSGRRLFAEAEREFRAIERQSSEDRWRCVWLTDWAEFCSQRGDNSGCEVAYREHASLAPNDTSSWILLGACLARQGKLKEAEAIHRHATQLRGDPDEAYLNLGYVL
jgi:Flp pilus assembly protein TadD